MDIASVQFIDFDPCLPNKSNTEPAIHWIKYLGELYPLRSRQANDLVRKKIECFLGNQSYEEAKVRNIVIELNSQLLIDEEFRYQLTAILFRERGNPPRQEIDGFKLGKLSSTASKLHSDDLSGKLDKILAEFERLRRETELK